MAVITIMSRIIKHNNNNNSNSNSNSNSHSNRGAKGVPRKGD